MSISRLRFAIASIASVLIVLPGALGACSSSSNPTPSGADAAGPETGAADTSTAADGGSDTSMPSDSGVCPTVVNGGGVVPETAGTGAVPAATGGTIVDGTYYLTKHEVYAPSTAGANTRRRTFVFSAGTFISHDTDPGKEEKQFSGTASFSGNKLTLGVMCPVTGTAVLDYTATPTTYTQHTKANDLFIFTKQ